VDVAEYFDHDWVEITTRLSAANFDMKSDLSHQHILVVKGRYDALLSSYSSCEQSKLAGARYETNVYTLTEPATVPGEE
jgi:hypothetical protein